MIWKKMSALIAAGGVLLGLSGCRASSAKPAPQKITVFAAASLTESFNEIGRNLLKSENIQVTFNFAGSQQLAAQIEQGTPADVAAFASESYMKEIQGKGYVGDYQIFTKNALVACKEKGSAKTLRSLADLGAPGLSLIVGDESVPCGSYFVTVLSKSQLTAAQKNAINANIKSKELNVKDVLAKVQSGNGDFGVVYATDITKDVSDKVEAVKLPEFDSITPQYPISVLKESKNAEAAQKFMDYVLSDQGKAILKSYQFLVS